MKNVLALLALSVMSVSCINLEGSLNVNQLMNAKKKGGFLNLQTKNVEIQPGAYRASLKVNSARKFTLKLKSDKADESDILIPIKSKTDFSIPSNGTIAILGSDVGQPFDLGGNIQTDVSNSEIIKTNESCSYNVTERRCEKICHEVQLTAEERKKLEIVQAEERRSGRESRPVPPRIICDIVCNNVIVTLYGNRYVEYHNRYTQRYLKANLIQQDSKTILATFSGSDTESERVNDYYGECR